MKNNLHNNETEDIYLEIAAGNLPSKTKLVELLADDPVRLTQALQARAFIDIATIQEDIEFATEKEEIQKLGIKLSHARWIAERLLPDIYGQKQKIEIVEKTPIAETQLNEILETAMEKISCQKS
jgi:hypothetical protein